MANDETTGIDGRSGHAAHARNRAVIATPLPGELILLDSGTGEMYSLNSTGRFVWERLTDTPFDAMVDEFVREFGVARERARDDVSALISDLSGRALIGPADAVRDDGCESPL